MLPPVINERALDPINVVLVKLKIKDTKNVSGCSAYVLC